jgi:hypothetical protein
VVSKWTDTKYKNFIDKKRKELFERDSCYDNAGEFVINLLMHTDGLGPFMRKKMHVTFPQVKLIYDIVNGI